MRVVEMWMHWWMSGKSGHTLRYRVQNEDVKKGLWTANYWGKYEIEDHLRWFVICKDEVLEDRKLELIRLKRDMKDLDLQIES